MVRLNNRGLKTKGELERFLSAELDLDGYESEPLRWWQERSKKAYPTLAGLAFTVFSIPVMSSECERAFSRAGKIVTDERYQLKADQLLKSWLVSGLINRDKAWRVMSEIEQLALLNQNQGQRQQHFKSLAAASDNSSDLTWRLIPHIPPAAAR